MKNLEKSVASNDAGPSQGVVIVAQPTSSTDYPEIARRAARFIERNLQLPVTIVQPNTPGTNIKKQGTPTEWRNLGRWSVYDGTPYHQTILLDADYLCLTPTLLRFLDLPQDYQIVQRSHTATGQMRSAMGNHYHRHLWATIIVFHKTDRTKALFRMVERIERNWSYYARLFQADHQTFRNDLAFTMADLVINGYEPGRNIPHSMLTIPDPIHTIRPVGNLLNIKTKGDHKLNLAVATQDLHIMDKEWWLSQDFLDFEVQLYD